MKLRKNLFWHILVFAVLCRAGLYGAIWLFGISIENHERTDANSFRWRHAQNWDGYWYIQIARAGYPRNPGTDVRRLDTYRFFPGYSTLLKWAGALFGGNVFRASLVVSQLLYLLLLWFLFLGVQSVVRGEGTDDTGEAHSYVGLDSGGSLPALFWSVAALVSFPSSFVLALPYSEALFVTAGIGFWVGIRRCNVWLMLVCGFVAGATRITGFFLSGLAVAIFFAESRWWRQALLPKLSALRIIGYFWVAGAADLTREHAEEAGPLPVRSCAFWIAAISPFFGSAAAVLFLAASTGEFDLFVVPRVHALGGYGFSFPWATMMRDWQHPEIFWIQYPVYFTVIAALIHGFRRQPVLAGYGLVLLGFHLCHSTLGAGLRMALEAWPFFIIFGLWARTRNGPAVYILILFAFWQAFCLVRFINDYWVF